MKRILSIFALSAVALLAACGEKPQTNAQGVKRDTAPSSGPETAFTAPGWKPGDQASWEAQIKARMQAGQNDYNRIN
jgi:ABC-type glycerol-3-phosphate transport system substrate-binding protein